MWVGAACVKQSGEQLDLLRPGERKTSLSRADPTYRSRDQGSGATWLRETEDTPKIRLVLLKGTEMGLQEPSNDSLDFSDGSAVLD